MTSHKLKKISLQTSNAILLRISKYVFAVTSAKWKLGYVNKNGFETTKMTLRLKVLATATLTKRNSIRKKNKSENLSNGFYRKREGELVI